MKLTNDKLFHMLKSRSGEKPSIAERLALSVFIFFTMTAILAVGSCWNMFVAK